MRLFFVFYLLFFGFATCFAQPSKSYFLDKKNEVTVVCQPNQINTYTIAAEKADFEGTEKIAHSQQSFAMTMQVVAIEKNSIAMDFVLPKKIILWRAVGERSLEQNTDNQSIVIKTIFEREKAFFTINNQKEVLEALQKYANTLPNDEKDNVKNLQSLLAKKDISTLEKGLTDIFYWFEAYNFPNENEKSFSRQANAIFEKNQAYTASQKKLGKNIFYSYHQTDNPTKHRFSIAYDEQGLPLSVGFFYTSSPMPNRVIHTWSMTKS